MARVGPDLPHASLDETRTGATEPGAPSEPRSEARAHGQARDPDRYEIVGEHGRGGIGRVSRAFDRDLGRDVAIKELIERNHVSEVRFLREAMITARLEHPGIVPVHEAGRWHDGTPFYAMKLVAGRPLRDLIAERTTVDDRIALLHHVIAVADAMAYAHRRHIIHRDLKPGNIIVGDFGETVVIDWGLAKDLSSSFESDDLGSASPTSPTVNDLTATGSVLGTPAYMAPEQARGEAVDQRVDVFAIGAMLWELCALDKVPPSNLRQRHALLRRNGIDRDLITILDKALAPAPEDRYLDAGALAADLKAFKAGARIAARDYSLPALLAHWTRRHRVLALAIAALVVLAIIGGTLYVRNIASERDRADASQHTAVEALDALTLRHAQHLLAIDPAAALDELASYRGPDTSRARQIEAEAHGRAAPLLHAFPHRHKISWLHVIADASGQLEGILSGSEDNTIAFTSRDGKVRVLARNVSNPGTSLYSADAYSSVRNVLAYTCEPDDVCMLDTKTLTASPAIPALHGLHLLKVAFSPSGNLLATLSRTNTLTIFDITDLTKPIKRQSRQLAARVDMHFIDETEISVISEEWVSIIAIGGRTPTNDISQIPLTAPWSQSTDSEQHRVAVATDSGDAIVIERSPWHITARAKLCQGRASAIRLIHNRREIAYACREGVIGLWNPDTGEVTPRVHLEGRTLLFEVSPDGDYLIVSADGKTDLLDLHTNLLTVVKGFTSWPTVLFPSSAHTPFVAVGDAHGEIRVWSLPPRIAKITLDGPSILRNAGFVPGATSLVTMTEKDEIAVISPGKGTRTATPHDNLKPALAFSADGSTFAAYGVYHEEIELWSAATMTRSRVFSPGHGTIAVVRFLTDDPDFLTSGSDGRLLRWSLADTTKPTEIAKLDQAIENFAVAPGSRAVVLQGRDGSLWQAPLIPTDTTPPIRLNPPQAASVGAYKSMLTDQDGVTVYAGLNNGDVLAIDTRDRHTSTVLHADGMIQQLVRTPDGTQLAVSTITNRIYLGTRTRTSAAWTWRSIELPTTNIALAPDGMLVSLEHDGTIWLYSVSHDRWLCIPIGTVELHRVLISTAGDDAAAIGIDGKMIWIDLAAARELFAREPATAN